MRGSLFAKHSRVDGCSSPRNDKVGVRRLITILSLSMLVGCGGSEANDDSNLPSDSAAADDTSAPADSAVVVSDDGSPGDTAAEDTAIDAGKDTAPPAPTTALLRPDKPMPCADPAVVSETNASKVFYVYCTSMSHVWKTTDWISFSDVRSSVTFTLTGLSANGKEIGSWWAPGLVYSPALKKYVMWVSVPDAQGTKGTDGWDTRSLAVLTAGSPTGPWTYAALAIDASPGERFIDPYMFIDSDGARYAYWKQYGGGVSSSIMGARVDATWTKLVSGTSTEVMNGYGGAGTWEDNVRENPAVVRDSGGRYHMLFSGGHWFNETYATAHALSSCGPLCPASSSGGWHMVDSGDRGILQVVRSIGNPKFANGGPGGAVFVDDTAKRIVYAAAAKSASGDKTRYLMLDDVQWAKNAPFVDTAGHEPLGY
jgi:hypothetical protein